LKERRSRPGRNVDLGKLSGALEVVRHHLDRAEAALLVAASTRAAAPEIDASLAEVKAATSLISTLHEAVNEEIYQAPPKVRCGHCHAEMMAAAGRCGACRRITAKA
jgi:hypothetical protein